MLEKIVQIKNIGRFRNFHSVGDVAFKKLTLIYADNGRGKSTLCAVLRSQQSGQTELINERKTLAAGGDTFVNLRLNGTNVEFTNNEWNSTKSDFVIFDSVFVHNNVYSGNYVEHEHKKNLYRVIVGEKGVALAREIDEMDTKSRNISGDIREKKTNLEKCIPANMTLDQYLNLSAADDIDAKIKQKTEDIAARQRTIEKAAEIQERGLLSKIQIPSLPSEFYGTLDRTIADVAADSEKQVRAHLSRCMDERGEAWLEQGLEYIKDKQCPFCAQDISSIALINAFQSYFNIEYKNLKSDVAELEKSVGNAIGETALIGVERQVANNLALIEFWRQFSELKIPEYPEEPIRNAFQRLRDECNILVAKKLSNPLDAIPPGDGIAGALREIDKYNKSIDIYNLGVNSINDAINKLKETSSRPGELAMMNTELETLKVLKSRFEEENVAACQEYLEALDEKKKLDETKRDTKKKLDQYCADILNSYENSINEYLDKFNASFRIVNSKHQYTGGTPSSDFQIEINNTPIELGNSRTPPGRPCFRTTLSSGDRSALALAFFLAALRSDPQLSNRIVVFDDPFTSLDRFRRTYTQILIQKMVDTVKQVIVLSHDSYFLKLLWNECPKDERKALLMIKSGDTTDIREWDIISDVQNENRKDLAILQKYFSHNEGDPRSVIRALRPFLEGWLKSQFPNSFQSNEWLKDFIVKIRDAGTNSELQSGKVYLEELTAINHYSKKHHHGEGSVSDPEPINATELHGFVKRCLRLVGGE